MGFERGVIFGYVKGMSAIGSRPREPGCGAGTREYAQVAHKNPLKRKAGDKAQKSL
jgi:hypothetical protein